MRNRNIGIVAVVVLVLAAVTAIAAPRIRSNNAVATATPSPTATAVVQQQIVSFDGEEGKTALASLKAKYVVETKQFSFGEMVQSINTLAADDAHYWAFYVNGAQAAVGAGDYVAKSGDKIEFRFEKL